MHSTNDTRDQRDWAALVVAVSYLFGSLAYSMHAASFLHPKVAVFLLGSAVLLWIGSRRHSARAWEGVLFFLPLWLYLIAGIARAYAGLSPALLQSQEAFLLLAPSLLFTTLSWPYLSFEFVKRMLMLATVLVAAVGLGQYAGWLDYWLPPVPTYTQAMYSVFGNQDLLGGFVALGVVLAAQGLLRKGEPPALHIAAMAVLLPAWLLAGSRTAWLAGVIGLAVSLLCMDAPPRKRLVWLGAAGAVAIVLIAFLSPMTTIERVTGTFAEGDEGGWLRLWFWDGTLRMIASAPFFGVGFGVFAYESPRFLGEAVMYSEWIQHSTTELTVFHAHSDPLEALAEMGLLGAILLGWMAWRLRAGRGPAWGPLSALLVFSCFNATVISPPHAVAGLMLMACLAPRSGAPLHAPARWQSALMVLVSSWLIVITPFYLIIPSFQLRTAQTAHLEGSVDPARYERAARRSALAPEAWASLGQWHVEQEEWEDAIATYERALPDMDTGRLHLELGALHYRTGNLEAAREHLGQAVLRWPWNYDAWRLFIAAMPVEARPSVMARALRWTSEEDAARLEALFTPPE